ncbi:MULTISPECIES: bifunctional precorrin-2 dehydrogenase/sirohydrochlorin ferrochelatase [unclassified Sphingomonas]|jgi:uroporphyrin-III C-methyltransferase / precorrin-2 dehydrogenase / sirohydrochlorin ferrochelatase|uniref:precorrin-2 dehydrogenase/sirohydrochlorin ferrochelatase family protein n=3 Tax=Bacteria TaxID=2 RepID=UPI0018E54C7B|nr:MULTISPECIES: bifunctional precorrin-2 dehydrogenase/sirohydrochlorin ferrochelatase [unclassified Sphingomonas]
MSLHSLPLFVRLAGRPVMLIGEGDAADAKRRLLERAGATIVGEDASAALAIVAHPDPDAIVARLKTRGLLVNAVDRPDLCDFTLPAIVDRDPVIVAIGTGGVSAGLAAALRQRLEALLPARLGALARELFASRAELRERWPDGGERRRMLAAGMAAGGLLDPLGNGRDGDVWTYIVTAGAPVQGITQTIRLRSDDPDDLTLREARALAGADRVIHDADVPAAILDRARADAERLPAPADAGEGLTVRIMRA